MALKKVKPTEDTTTVVAVSDKQVHILTHTARMLEVVARKPDHVRGPDYERQLAIYSHQWSQLTAGEKAAVKAGAITSPGMTHLIVSAAIAALEE